MRLTVDCSTVNGWWSRSSNLYFDTEFCSKIFTTGPQLIALIRSELHILHLLQHPEGSSPSRSREADEVSAILHHDIFLQNVRLLQEREWRIFFRTSRWAMQQHRQEGPPLGGDGPRAGRRALHISLSGAGRLSKLISLLVSSFANEPRASAH